MPCVPSGEDKGTAGCAQGWGGCGGAGGGGGPRVGFRLGGEASPTGQVRDDLQSGAPRGAAPSPRVCASWTVEVTVPFPEKAQEGWHVSVKLMQGPEGALAGL